MSSFYNGDVTSFLLHFLRVTPYFVESQNVVVYMGGLKSQELHLFCYRFRCYKVPFQARLEAR